MMVHNIKFKLIPLGIPLKMSKDMKYERAVHYAALFSELWSASKKVVQKDLRTLTDVRIDVKKS